MILLALFVMVAGFSFVIGMAVGVTPYTKRNRNVSLLNATEVRAILQAAQENLVDVEPFVEQIMAMKPQAVLETKRETCTVRLRGSLCGDKAVMKAIVNLEEGKSKRSLCQLHYRLYKKSGSILSEVELDKT